MYSNKLSLSHKQAINNFWKQTVPKLTSIGKPYDIVEVGQNCDVIEYSLLYAFGIDISDDIFVTFTPPDANDLSNTIFELGIRKDEAINLVENINKEFSNAAVIVGLNCVSDDRIYQRIAIDSRVLTSEKFLATLSKGLKKIAENEPKLLEKFQLASKTPASVTIKN